MSTASNGITKATQSILFVHWGHEGIRGSERVLLDLLSRIDRARYSPRVWCNTESLREAVVDLEIPALVSTMPILLGWDVPRFDVPTYLSLVREGTSLIRDSQARLVHVSSGAPNQWMVPAARNMKVPLIAHLHAVYTFRERCTLLLHEAPIVAGCSEAVLAPFRGDGLSDDRLRVIHNGVDASRLNEGSASTLRQSLRIGDQSALILGAGALVKLKGFDLLIKALGILRSKGIDAHLAIVGDGPEREQLEALANNLGLRVNVHFLGQRADVGAILRDAADIVAVPSRVEAFGLVAAEAGLFARPTVATAVGGLAEIVNDGVTGIVVPREDHVALSAGLECLIADRSLRSRLGGAARAQVLARFTAERVARDFQSLYDELTAQPHSHFGWSKLGFGAAPFVRLGMAVAGRRLGLRMQDA